MSYLVDTDWVADFLVNRPPAVQLLSALASDGIAISIATYGEIYEGIVFGRDREARETGFTEFLAGVDVLPLSQTVIRRFAEVRGELRRQGNLIGDMDLMIASTALTYDLTLVTRNRPHFERVPSLQLYGTS